MSNDSSVWERTIYTTVGSAGIFIVLPSCCGNGCHLPSLMGKALTAASEWMLESAVLLTVVKTSGTGSSCFDANHVATKVMSLQQSQVIACFRCGINLCWTYKNLWKGVSIDVKLARARAVT